MEHKCDGGTSYNWRTCNCTQSLAKWAGRVGNRRSQDHSKSSIVEIGQNTGKSPGYLWGHAFSRTPVKYHNLADSIHRGKIEQIQLAYGIPKETIAAITIL